MQIVIVAVALVVMAGIGYFFLGTGANDNMMEVKMPESQNQDINQNNAEANTNTNANTGTNINAEVKLNTNTSTYKDGTYTQTGVYNSPAGGESVTVSVTLKDGVVTNSTFKGSATNKASINNQGKFAAGFSGVVVGQPVDSIALTVVNGSSLTPKGFMDALSKIKSEAKM